MWTDDAIAVLRDLWREGYSATQIARVLKAARLKSGATRNAVIGKLHRIGLCGRRSAIQPKRKAGKTEQHTSALGRKGRLRVAAVKAAEPRMAQPLPQPAPDALPPLNTPLADLRFGMCRAIVAGTGADALFCGHAVADGSSWCAHHRARYVVAAPPRKRGAVGVDPLRADIMRQAWAVGA